MIQFNGSVVLVDGVPATMQELVQAAIAARDYGSAAKTAAEGSRFQGGRMGEGFLRPTADIYMIDAYKGIKATGKVDTASWAAVDFTAEPGGGELIAQGVEKHFNNGVDIQSRVLFQNSGGNVTVYCDFSFS